MQFVSLDYTMFVLFPKPKRPSLISEQFAKSLVLTFDNPGKPCLSIANSPSFFLDQVGLNAAI